MKNNSLVAVKVVLAAALTLSSVLLSRAEGDASAQLTINNGTMSVTSGTISFSSLANTISASGDAANVNFSSTSPIATAASSSFSSGTGSANLPSALLFNVNASAGASSSLPGLGSTTGSGQGGQTGLFTISGGTGTVSVTFSIPISGFTSTFANTTGEFVQASDSLTLSLLSAGGAPIVNQLFSLTSGTGTGSAGTTITPNTVSDTVILNYNQQYQVNLLANALTQVSSVPEPTTTTLVVLGLGTGLFLKRRQSKKTV